MVLRQFGTDLELMEVPKPKPKDNEVLVKIRACGVCATDLKIVSNRMQPGIITLPHIPGHEAAGEIVQLGSNVNNWKVGDRVCVYFYYTCGSCKYCLNGRSTLCNERKRPGFELDGGYSEYLAVPENNLVRIPDGLDFDTTCVLSDAMATVYRALISRGNLTIGETVLIVGIGGLGIHALQIAKASGASVIAADIEDERLQVSKDYGADFTINTKNQDPVKLVKDITKDEGVDVVLNLVGTPDVFSWSLDALSRGGRFLLVGYVPGAKLEFTSPPFHTNELEIIGSRAATKNDLEEVLKLANIGLIKPVVSRVYSLDQANEALTAVKKGKILGRAVLMI